MNPFDVSKKVEKKIQRGYLPTNLRRQPRENFFLKFFVFLFRLSSILYIGIVCVNLWFVWPLFKRERERDREKWNQDKQSQVLFPKQTYSIRALALGCKHFLIAILQPKSPKTYSIRVFKLKKICNLWIVRLHICNLTIHRL